MMVSIIIKTTLSGGASSEATPEASAASSESDYSESDYSESDYSPTAKAPTAPQEPMVTEPEASDGPVYDESYGEGTENNYDDYLEEYPSSSSEAYYEKK